MRVDAAREDDLQSAADPVFANIVPVQPGNVAETAFALPPIVTTSGNDARAVPAGSDVKQQTVGAPFEALDDLESLPDSDSWKIGPDWRKMLAIFSPRPSDSSKSSRKLTRSCARCAIDRPGFATSPLCRSQALASRCPPRNFDWADLVAARRRCGRYWFGSQEESARRAQRIPSCTKCVAEGHSRGLPRSAERRTVSRDCCLDIVNHKSSKACRAAGIFREQTPCEAYFAIPAKAAAVGVCTTDNGLTTTDYLGVDHGYRCL